MYYRASPDVLAAKLSSETVLLDMDSKSYFQLNGTAAHAWDILERGATLDDLVAELSGSFEGAEVDVREDTEELLRALLERRLVTESE